jgi:hypothetical protein
LVCSHVISAVAPAFAVAAAVDRALPVPLHASPADVALYLHSHPLHIDPKKEPAVLNTGWSSMEDVKGKPGLIAFRVGETVVFALDAARLKKHARVGALHVQHLKSYEHMGTLQVTLTHVDGDAPQGCNATAQTVLASVAVDCQWMNHVSEVIVESISFTPPSAGCMCLNFTVAHSSVPRVENKIKLVGLVLY